jgi:predicted HTH domain antitoxin
VESWLQRCPPAPDHLTPVTHTVEIQVSDETLAALQCDPRSYAAELRVAAAAKLYESGRVSRELAADIAGLSRAELMRAISETQVSPFQDTPESLKRELERA